LPLDFGDGELVLIALYWLTVSLFVGTSGLVFGGLYKLIAKVIKYSLSLQYALLPILWVTAEVAGSYLLSIFTYGPGSIINGYFSLGYVGLLLAEHQHLLLLAKLGGVYFLSAIAVLFSVWLSRFLTKRVALVKLLIPISVFAVLLLSNRFPLFAPVTPSETTTVAVINIDFPVVEAFSRDHITDWLEEQDKALTAAVTSGAGYILTPEDARFFNQTNGPEQATAYFDFRHGNADVVIIDSSRVPGPEGAVLQGLVYDSSNKQHFELHKKYLVPQGEFIPHFYNQLFRFLGFSYLIDELEQLLSYTIGPNTSQAQLPDHIPGVLFCFESSSGTGVRDLLKERPAVPFIAHPVSHTWFNEPDSLWSQLESSLQVQAVWNDVAIVSATQHGPSQMFLPTGRIETPQEIADGEYWSVGLFNVPIR
jgi:apolipoprotein N-acyltransferase